jgi:hypothetical protein
VKEIRFTDATKEWLNSIDWPASAYGDFDKIAKHNSKVKANCPSTGASSR